MNKDISAMAFWKAAGPYSEGVSHRFTDSLTYYHQPIILAHPHEMGAPKLWNYNTYVSFQGRSVDR